MNYKAKKILKNARVLIVLATVLLELVAIHPSPNAEGVTIRSVMTNSSASLAGIASPKPTAPPTSKERITSMNNIPIKDITDYYKFISELIPNRTIQIKTDQKLYRLTTKPLINTTVLSEQEQKIGLQFSRSCKTMLSSGGSTEA